MDFPGTKTNEYANLKNNAKRTSGDRHDSLINRLNEINEKTAAVLSRLKDEEDKRSNDSLPAHS